MRKIIDQRNVCTTDYYKHVNSLNERKNKKLLEDKSNWDLDLELILKHGLKVEEVKSNTDLAKSFMFTAVG